MVGLVATDSLEETFDQSKVAGDENGSFKTTDGKITVKIGSSEEIVQDTTGVANVKTEDITQDSEATSPFSGAEVSVLAEIETEENRLEEGAGIEASEGTLELGDGSAELIEVAIEKVIVVIDEFQVKGDNESEASQIDVVEVTFFESGELVSEGNNFSRGGFTSDEVDEGRVSLGEAKSSEFTVGGNITLSEESVGNNVLVILTLDDVS